MLQGIAARDRDRMPLERKTDRRATGPCKHSLLLSLWPYDDADEEEYVVVALSSEAQSLHREIEVGRV